MRSQLHTLAALSQRREGGPQGQSGYSGEEKIVLPLLGIELMFVQHVA